MLNYNPRNFPGIANPTENFTISASVTKTQMEDLKKGWGIDVFQMVKNALDGEMHMSISKLISDISFQGDVIEINKEKLYEKIKSINKPWFAITNMTVATYLQAGADFLSDEFNIHNRLMGLYCVGKYAGNKFYVDPYLRWDDNRITFVFNDIIIYDIPTEKQINKKNIKIIENTPNNLLIQINFKVKKFKADNEIYKVNNIDITNI